jgi:glycogen synthase
MNDILNSSDKEYPSYRILILSWELLPVYAGGLGVLVRDVVDELINQNCEVDVLLPRVPAGVKIQNGFTLPKIYNKHLKEGKPMEEISYDSISMQDPSKITKKPWLPLFINKRGSKIKNHFVLYPNSLPKHIRAYARTAEEYLKSIDKTYDLVIGMDWHSIPAFTLIKKSFPKLSFYFHVNSTEWDRTPNPRKFSPGYLSNCYLESTYFKEADKILAISNITKQMLIEHCEVPVEKIEIISNNITFNPEKNGFTELDKGKNVLFIGRVDGQKGLGFLLDTAERVTNIDPQIRFLIAGDGPEIPNIIEAIAEKGLEKQCLIMGWVNNDQKRQLYKSADLFVMTSPSEPFGLTPLEAIISDVPVISSKKCGFLDVIPSTPTYDYYDTNRFSELLVYYINDKKARNNLLKKQQEEYKNHSWSEQIKKILILLNENKPNK